IVRGTRRRRLPAKVTLHVRPGDRLCVETPGGGGFGSARRRGRRGTGSGRLGDALDAALEVRDPALQVRHALCAREAGAGDGPRGDLRDAIDDEGADALALRVEPAHGLGRALAGVFDDVERRPADEGARILAELGDELATLGPDALHGSSDVVERK